MSRPLAEKRLQLTSDIIEDDSALELIAVWFAEGKAKVFTRTGTRLDEKPEIWAEILVGLIDNISDHIADNTLSKETRAAQLVDLVQKQFDDRNISPESKKGDGAY